MAELPKRALITSKLIDNVLQTLKPSDLDDCYSTLSNLNKKAILDSIILSNGNEAINIFKTSLTAKIKNEVDLRLNKIRDDGFVNFADLSDFL